MALVTFGAVTVVWLLLLFLSAGKVLSASEPEQAMKVYQPALSRAGKAYGVVALWAFGVRFEHIVNGVSWVIGGVASLL